MNDPVNHIRSALPGISWPAVPGPEGAQMLALQFQLERSQWLPPEALRELQLRQLDALLRHAYGTVPYYRNRWSGLYDPGAPLVQESFLRIPLLTRAELQANFETLKSTGTPASHGRTAESRTSGSTGQPVRVLKTELVELLWRSVVLREHQWFRRNLGGKLAAIRQGAGNDEADGWGPATDSVFRTGRSATLNIRTDVDSQLRWLQEQQPDYLLTYPSNLAALARASLAGGVRLPRLRETRTMGEALPEGLRELCGQAWGVGVTDSYSSNEVGYIALQCPENKHYHVQAETVLAEVLDDQGAAARPGEMGRVVVTDLHNFALPLVRYDIGDYAEAGATCSCGRGLPVLSRIGGRVRNMLVLEDGRKYWPILGSQGFDKIAPIRQHQFVQKSPGLIEVRLVADQRLTRDQEEALRRHIQSRLPGPFDIRFLQVPEIARGAGGKYEVFLSEIT